MAKSSKKFKKNNKSLLPKSIKKYYDILLEGMLMRANEPVDSPKNLQEFVSRVDKILEESFERNFGFQHYLKDRKYIKSNPTIENLIKVECDLEKQRRGEILVINQDLDGYKFLKLALERNYPFTVRAQHFLGIFIDRSKITKPQKLTIGIQAAAQVLWFIKKEIILSIKGMRENLLGKNSKNCSLWKFLNILNLQTKKSIKLNERIVENWIRKICPIPKRERKRFHKINNSCFSNIIYIPGIFLSNPSRINFSKLRIGIITLTKNLFFQRLSLKEIQNHPILLAYKKPLKYYLKDYVNDWIEEGFHSNGTIFDV